MDSRLAGLLALWRPRSGEGGSGVPAALASHADHLLVIESGDGHLRYQHYGRAFVERFGADLAGQAVDMLPAEVVTAERRGMLEFDYLFVLGAGKPLWRSYTADFGGRLETWQRLVLPLDGGRLAVGAYPAEPAATADGAGESLLRLVIGRVPVVLGEDGEVEDLALTLEAFSSTRRQMAELEVLATRDPLTGVPNHRHFHHLASLELDHARRMGRAFAVVSLDIDHFKRINDTWGHAAGDVALRAFAAACRGALREPDILGRLGGEEFAVALPNTGLDAAVAVAERLRAQVAETVVPLQDGGTLAMTVSIGVAACGDDCVVADLLARADAALYRSKQGGRDRVTVG